MSFGQKILEKYGWKEGDGLGKQNDGIKKPIKTKIKNNTFGLDYKLSSEYSDNWWENVFSEAASNIIVKDDDNGCHVVKSVDEVEILPHMKKKTRRNIKEGYSVFEKAEKVKTKLSEQIKNVNDNIGSDHELFEQSSKRKVYTGRYGLTMSGKLARLEEQEKNLAQIKKVTKIKVKRKKK